MLAPIKGRLRYPSSTNKVAGGLIRGRLSEKHVLRPLPHWRGDSKLLTLLLAGKEASLKYTQAWSRQRPGTGKSGLQQQKANAINSVISG